MEKVLTIDGRQVSFKGTGAFLLRYKAQFRRDALRDLFKVHEMIEKQTVQDEVTKEEKDIFVIKDIDALDLEVLYNIIWTLAKTADQSIPPPMEWLDTFETFPLKDIIPELKDMLFSCLRPTSDSKKKE